MYVTEADSYDFDSTKIFRDGRLSALQTLRRNRFPGRGLTRIAFSPIYAYQTTLQKTLTIISSSDATMSKTDLLSAYWLLQHLGKQTRCNVTGRFSFLLLFNLMMK